MPDDVKLSALPAAAALDGSEAIPIVQAGATVKATARAVAAAGRQLVIKAADETVNNSATFQDDNELILPVVAGAAYELEAMLLWDSSTTADIQFRFAALAGATGIVGSFMPAVGATISNAGLDIRGINTFSGRAYGGGGAGVYVSGMWKGLLTTTTTPGNLTLQWAQAVAEVSNTVLKAGSYMRLERLV